MARGRADPGARREFLAAGSAAALAVAATPLRQLTAGASPQTQASPVTPPGSGSLELFAARCTACQLCVTVCPTRVLQPALLEYGSAGLLQPRLSFRHGFCDYECQRCTAICPPGALRPLPLEEKQRTQLGIAKLYKQRCIVYRRGEERGACAEVCPTHAVYTQEQDGLLCPEMAPAACIGCGACEYACPESPKAIAVQASAVHGQAALPYVPGNGETPRPNPPAVGGPPGADFPF